MAENLESVEQAFISDLTRYLAGLDAGIAKAAEFAAANKEAEDAVAALALAANDAATVIAASMDRATRAVAGLAAAMAALDSKHISVTASVSGISGPVAGAIAQVEALKAAMAGLGGATVRIGTDMSVAGARTAAATGLMIGGFRLTNLALHGIISGAIELAAVVIPAAVAAGAWAAVWAESAQSVYQHMSALYTATEATGNMFHVTAGQALGLGDALQRAQAAARPDVFQALGAAVNAVRGHMGQLSQAGLEVGRIFDTFAAKVVYDMSAAGGASGKLNTLLANMVPDLVKIGEIFGNLGHALLNFAAAMPGLANVMLNVADALSRVVLWLSQLPAPLITAVFALHEFNTWGSIAATALGLVGLATTTLSGSFFGLGRAQAVFLTLFRALPMLIATGISAFGSMLVPLGRFAPSLAFAGMSIRNFGADLTDATVGITFWQAALITAGAIGLGILIDKLITAKTAAQQFAASLQASVMKASNVQALNVLAAAMGSLTAAAVQSRAAMDQMGPSLGAALRNARAAGAAATGLASYYNSLGDATRTYTAAQRQMAQQFVNVGAGATYLANTYHTSLLGAMVLADAAGVKLASGILGTGQAAVIARIKIMDLVQGYIAMGQPAGAVGADMTALAIQSGLAATKVAALNQAWDQFMSNLTGGTAGLAAFAQSMANIGTVVGNVTNNLGQATSISLNMKQFTDALAQGPVKAAGAWTNFDQVIGSTVPQVTDWLRTAGAEGALSGKQFSQGILDMLSQLTPLAGKSKTAQAMLVALAQQAGLGIHSFAGLTGAISASHASTADLAKIVAEATIKMADMGQVAQQLGNVMNTDIVATLDNARLSVSGAAAAAVAYTNDLRNNTAASSAGQSARAALIHDLEFTGLSARAATALVNTYTGSVLGAANASQQAARQVDNLILQLRGLHDKTVYLNIITTGNVPPQITIPGAHGASGGVIPGYAPGHDTVRAMLSPGEGILTPEAVRGLGAGFVHAANRYFSAPRIAGAGFGTGGIAPAMPSALRSAAHVSPALASAASGGGGGGMQVHNHYSVTVNNAGSVLAEQELGRTLLTVLNRQTGRNMGNQLWLPGRTH